MFQQTQHNLYGFCGQALQVKLHVSFEGTDEEDDIDDYLDSLIVVGEFFVVGEKQDQKVPLEWLVPPRTTDCYIGEKVETRDISCEGKKSYLVSITFDPRAWNYTWSGNRHRKYTKHVFSVSVLHPLHNIKSPHSGSASDLLKLKSFDSTPFVIDCMRRSSKERKVALRRSDAQPQPQADSDPLNCSVCSSSGDENACDRPNKLQKLDTEGNSCMVDLEV